MSAWPDMSPREYFLMVLPSDADEAIAETIHALLDSPQSPRGDMSDSQAWFLIAFAARMASLSVREQNRVRLEDALMALVLEGGMLDLRETLQALSLIYDASTRIGADGALLFNRAADHDSSSRVGEAIRQFPGRAADDRSIESMGFKAVGSGPTFMYERRW